MGYTTDFKGSLSLSKNLTDEQKQYINDFSGTRRMSRDVNKLMTIYDGKHGYPGIPTTAKPEEIYGVQGQFFVFDDGDYGQNQCPSITNYNSPPIAQPGLWCQWVITSYDVTEKDGTKTVKQRLVWDGGEKFYAYVVWLKYLIDRFFNRWGVLLNGKIEWQGEESSDMGKIVVVDNVVKTKRGFRTYR